MPYLFTDDPGTYDIPIPNSGLWVPGATLPNGEPSSKPTGSGEAWVMQIGNDLFHANTGVSFAFECAYEFWVNVADPAVSPQTRFLFGLGASGWPTSGRQMAALLKWTSPGTRTVELTTYRSSSGSGGAMRTTIGTVAVGWNHVYFEIRQGSGSAWQLLTWINSALVHSSANDSTGWSDWHRGGNQRFYLGNVLDNLGVAQFSTANDHLGGLAKLTYYNASQQLTQAEINQHYRAMTFV